MLSLSLARLRLIEYNTGCECEGQMFVYCDHYYLIQQVARIEQQEVRWHVAQMFHRLELSKEERAVVVEILLDYLDDKSKIVKTSSMQALADFAERDAGLRSKVIKLLEELARTGSPAMRSRGRKLLGRLNRLGSEEI